MKNKLEKLIDTFISSSETMQKFIEKKIKELEHQINKIELEASNHKAINFNKEKYIRDINNKIYKLKEELTKSLDKEFTRKQMVRES